MKSAVQRMALGIALAAGLSMPAFSAEETTAKALPTLLVKGEVVSVDSNDPAAVLLKIKDRYGFETPIYLAQATKIMQGEAMLNATNLATGNAVEVEYNFDINTAKRHAVSVKVATAPPAAQMPAALATPTAAPAIPAAPAALAPATTAPAAPMAPAAPAAAPVASPSSSAQPAMSTPPAAAPAAQPSSAPAPTTPAASQSKTAPSTPAAK